MSRDRPDQLIIALEPEAAAIFCTEKKMDAIQSERLKVPVGGPLSEPNAQYMVVDIGGYNSIFYLSIYLRVDDPLKSDGLNDWPATI